jgi:excisionase family DNA binding protein
MTASDLARVLRAAADEAERIASEQTDAPPTADELVSLEAAHHSTGISVRTMRAAIRAGDLEAAKVGREYRITRAALDGWLDGRRVRPSPRTEPTRELTAAERAIERARRAGALRVVGAGR